MAVEFDKVSLSIVASCAFGFQPPIITFSSVEDRGSEARTESSGGQDAERGQAGPPAMGYGCRWSGSGSFDCVRLEVT